MTLTWRQVAAAISELPEALKDTSAIAICDNVVRLDSGKLLLDFQSFKTITEDIFQAGCPDTGDRIIHDQSELTERETLVAILARKGWFALGD